MKKAIVITSINAPTKAVNMFANYSLSQKDINFYVVGDTKTEKDWKCQGVNFLSIDDILNGEKRGLFKIHSPNGITKPVFFLFKTFG